MPNPPMTPMAPPSTKAAMVREVTRYEIADGTQCSFPQDAERKAKDLLCNKLDEFIDLYFPTGHRPSTIRAINEMVNDPFILKTRLKAMLHIIDYGNE